MIIDKKCDYIVFTGGEPLLLGENLGDLIYLIEEEIKCQIGIYKASQLHYGIETNGTLSLLECAIKPYIWKQVSICLSPKYENGNPRYIDSSFYSHCINEKNNFKRVSLKLLLPFYLRYGEEYSALRFDDYYVQPLVVDQTQYTWDSIYRLTCQSVIEDLSKFGTMWRLSVQLNKLLGVK
jgi:organic radical activating enzyme